jgi:hypothetical protein
MNLAAAIALALATAAAPAAARADLSGRVLFNGLAVPGAEVTATGVNRTVRTLSDGDGAFRFVDLTDGTWAIRVEMRGFVTTSRDVTLPLPATADPLTFVLTMQSYEQIVRDAPAAAATTAKPPLTPEPPPEGTDIITGSVINGAATPYAQPRAFGNNRPKAPSRYSFAGNATFGNSALNARPFSFAGSTTPAPSYGEVQLGFSVTGPLKIPWVASDLAWMTLSYQHGSTHNAVTQSAVMPTAAERGGDFSHSPTAIHDPFTGLPFLDNVIPTSRISPQAAALLAYYPSPNAATSTGANYQTASLTSSTSDRLQFGATKLLRSGHSIDGTVALERTLGQSLNLFDFEDTSRQSSITGELGWSRRFSTHFVIRARYQLVRAASSVTPFFANRINVSGDAGIAGNDQDPASWGPPALAFPDVAGLSDAEHQRTVTTSHAPGGEVLIRRGAHNITIGGDVRWRRVNVESQPNPRGTLSFTGAASGDAFADFLLGIPAASALAFGSHAIRLRQLAPDAYVNDAWRPLPTLTLNVGVRWEYESPFTEASGRLANLDIDRRFTAAAAVVAANSTGVVTGASFPASLIRPDPHGIQPRLAVSWRPSFNSPFTILGSYGVYRNLGGYQSLALLLAEQPPFAKTFSIPNTETAPLTLANPFPSPVSTATNTVAIDPNFRTSYAHTWQASVQRELPASLTMVVAYLGTRGSHLMQAFLPNTYPAGATSPCPTCPSGFVYLTSNGTSLRHAAQVTLRRRLYQGLMASVQYTLSKSTDNAATFASTSITPGSLTLAQNWLDLDAERAPSSFDQRHLVTAQVQYSTGAGLHGGTLVDGVWGSLWKDWTITADLTTGSGWPFTPVAFLPVSGTGVVGVRPSLTGVPLAPTSAGSYANPAAFTSPASGTWGTAGRNSIHGPRQFSMDLSVTRVFRLGRRLNLEWRVSATNVLNRVTFASINTVITSPQFGLPTLANPMRTLHVSVRLRY